MANNITLGSAYLNRVYRRLGDHQVLATAAYNAGPRRVRSWLPEQQQEADIWIESIPFGETRRYVQRVFTYAVIYQQRLGKPTQRLSRLMPPIPAAETATAGTQAPHDHPG